MINGIPGNFKLPRSASGYELEAARGHSELMPAPDTHQHLELNLAEGGSLTYMLGGRDEELHAGELAVFWAAVPHQVVGRKNLRVLNWIHLPLSWFLQWNLPPALAEPVLRGALLREPDRRRRVHDTFAMRIWVDDIRSGVPGRRDAALAELRARLLRLSQTLADAAPAAPRPAAGPPGTTGSTLAPAPADGRSPDPLLKAARHIATHYTGELYCEDIARLIGRHPDYAGELFRRRFGLTMTQFITRHRVFHAQQLLASTDQSVSEIAFASGFGSVSQFNTSFRAVCGQSPRRYRATMRDRPE